MIEETKIHELLRLSTSGDRLFHREGQELEFKEQFNLAALADYFRDFAAFANNRGGYLIFGIKDAPRIRIGMSEKSISQFEKLDPEKISGFLLEIFSSEIRWEQCSVEVDKKHFGVFRVFKSESKPAIVKKDEGKDNFLKSGDIYYRYGGRTQKIHGAELQNIINQRIRQNNESWIDLVSKIGTSGPQNAAILDTEKSIIEKGENRVLVLDDNLATKLKFIKEGEFVEKNGATALKLVGDVVPVDRVEVVKRVKENLTKSYPLSAMELADTVQTRLPYMRKSDVWAIITDNDLKNNTDYSAYIFRNKRQEDSFSESNSVPSGVPSIYNHAAVDFIVNVVTDIVGKNSK